MDILIKNMEMPKSCEGCFACEEFSYECYDYCNILKAPTTRGERRKDCPLVALPEHGDLIDRDKASTQIVAEICQFCASAENGNCDWCLVQKCLEAIGRVPTIVEATE